MRRIIFLVTVFIIACRQPKAELNQAAAVTDTLVTFMKTTVNHYIVNHQAGEAEHVLDSIAPAIQQANDYRLTLTWLLSKEGQYDLQGRLDSARNCIDQALRLAKQYDKSGKDLITVKGKLANNLAQQKVLDSAVMHATEAYYMAVTIDTAQLPFICYRLYEMYAAMEDLSGMKKYVFEGFRRAREPYLQTAFASAIADYYNRAGQLDSAIAFFKAVEQDTAYSNPYFDAMTFENLGVLLTNNHQPEEGLQYHLKAMRLRNEDDYNSRSYINVASALEELGRHAAALSYLDKAALLARQEGDPVTVKVIWQERAVSHKGLGDYKAAFKALDSAFYAYDAEVDSALVLQARELEARYASAAKDQRINALSLANEANLQIRAQQRVIIVSISVAALAFLTAGLLFWRRRQLQVQLHKTSLQLQILSGQMEPHFIYNTLSVLLSFIRSNHLAKAIDYLNRFSRLLRQNLENTRTELVSVKKDIEALESYLHLQAMHFEGLFDYAVILPEDMDTANLIIPPLMIQPFVENAIMHGFKDIDYKGKLTIRLTQYPSILRCTIEDNGSGMPGDPPQKDKPHATEITRERLALLEQKTGRTGRLNIIDNKSQQKGQGVTVTLDIPYTTSK